MNFLIKELKVFKKMLFFSENEKIIFKHCKEKRDLFKGKVRNKNFVILCQEDPAFLGILGGSSWFFSKENNVYFLNASSATHWIGKFSYLKDLLLQKKWNKNFEKLGAKPLPSLNFKNKLSPHQEMISAEIFERLKKKEDVVDIYYGEIKLGDLIYDTYLRFKPSFTIDITDNFLKQVIRSAIFITDLAYQINQSIKPEIVIASYSGYIHYGIFVRVSLISGAKVYNCGFFDQIFREVKKDFPYQVKNYTKYKSLLEKTPLTKEQIEISRKKLEIRFKGLNDTATIYMKKSAYEGNDEILFEKFIGKKNRKRALVLLHCFFDCPHIYRCSLFPDFYEWVEFLLPFLRKEDFEIIVKPHPSGLPENGKIISMLEKRHPYANFLPGFVNNFSLIKKGEIDVALTMYGTAAHEFPFFGIPAINAGENPHLDFNFCKTPSSVDELMDSIKNLSDLKGRIDREEILKFYYIHNFFSDSIRLSEKDSIIFSKFILNDKDLINLVPPMTEILYNQLSLLF